MTAEQVSLFHDPIEDAWQEFNRHCPMFFNQVIRLAAQAKDRGETYLSMKLIFEQLRHKVPRGGNIIALNNNHTACATRQLQAERPDLADLFKTRRRHNV